MNLKISLLAVAFATTTLLSGGACAQHYQQTNLVADSAGQAPIVDQHLIDPWGIARSTSSPWWVNDRATGFSTLYNGEGVIQNLVVAVPNGSPTGLVFNGSTDFALTPGNPPSNPALFLFVSLTGTISGWNPNVNRTMAIQEVPPSSTSVLTGATIAQIGDTRYLYVADLRQAKIAVYDTNFSPVDLRKPPFHDDEWGVGDKWGFRDDDDDRAFRDPLVPSGFAPFNVQNIGNNLYVTFAQQNATKTFVNFGAGLGFVDVFSSKGKLLKRFEYGDWFNAPFGLVLAPTDFGSFSHKLIVGQFGSGQLLAFDAVTGKFEGKFVDPSNNVIAIPGIWGISFGAGQPAQTSGPGNSLYFAAGINQGNGGLFGTLTPVPADLTQGGDQ